MVTFSLAIPNTYVTMALTREFTYDENGRLLSSSEQEENSGLTTYSYTYDKVESRLSYVKRTQTTKHPDKTDVAESTFYQYNDSNQLVSQSCMTARRLLLPILMMGTGMKIPGITATAGMVTGTLEIMAMETARRGYV